MIGSNLLVDLLIPATKLTITLAKISTTVLQFMWMEVNWDLIPNPFSRVVSVCLLSLRYAYAIFLETFDRGIVPWTIRDY